MFRLWWHMIPNCFANNEFAILRCDLRWRCPLLTWFFLREFHIFSSQILLKVFHLLFTGVVSFCENCLLCFLSFQALLTFLLSFFLYLSASSGSSLLLIVFSTAFSFFLKLYLFVSSICRLLLLYIAFYHFCECFVLLKGVHGFSSLICQTVVCKIGKPFFFCLFFIFLLFNWKYQIIKEIIITESYRSNDSILNT